MFSAEDEDELELEDDVIALASLPALTTGMFFSLCTSTSEMARWRTLLAVVPASPTSACCKASKDRHADSSTGDTSSFADT